LTGDDSASACHRREANYGMQRKKEMIPLMMEDGYAPNGWLGIMMGTRLWYGFYGKTRVRRIVALHYRSSALYQILEHARFLYF
jgi:hypothetical protein